MQTILVVDDEMNIRQMLRIMLEMSGYRVIEAGDGIEALETAVAQKPDLMIMDITMPKLDGLSVCKKLRSMPQIADTPVVMASGDSAIYELEKKYRDYVNRFLRKPFQFDELLGMVTSLLNQPSLMPA